MLPTFDNHDERIRYLHVELERTLDDLPERPLPEGYRLETYRDGDRDEWIRIGMSAKEHASFEAGLDAWRRYYAGHEAELPGRMLFLVDPTGAKVGTATAFYDVIGGADPDARDEGWLHWVSLRREAQGKGLSKPLILAALHRLAALGYPRARIPTQTISWVAVKVYLDLGFRPTARSAREARDAWRILRRLTDHPALSAFDPASDDEVLAPAGDHPPLTPGKEPPMPTVRRADARDIPAILNLLVQVNMVHHNGRPDLFKGPTTKYSAEELRGILADDATPVFVCEGEGGAILGHGFCVFQQHLNSQLLTDVKTLYIDDICVDEAARGQGVGRALYEHILSFAREQGCYNVTLNVWTCNPGAVRFYEKLGLTPYKVGMEQILE